MPKQPVVAALRFPCLMRKTETVNFLLLPLSLAMFMETLDSTIVGVAIPSIARSFHMDPIGLKLVMTCYLMSLAVFVPISGWIADRFGPKKIFLSAMTGFICTSWLCGLSHTLFFLIAARTLQGLTAALMMPVARVILLHRYPREAYTKAIGTVVLPALIGPALGPTVGGIILHFLTWEWIFWVNIPFGLLGLYLGYKFIDLKPINYTVTPFDWSGFFLFTLGLTSVTAAMGIYGDDFHYVLPATGLLLIGIVLISLYFYYAKNKTYPILSPKLFQKTSFFAAMGINLFGRMTSGAVPFLVPLMIQLIWKKTPLYSGSSFIFFGAGMMFARYFIGKHLITRYGYYLVLKYNLLLNMLLFSLIGVLAYYPSYFLLIILLFSVGILTSQLYFSIGSLYPIHLETSEYSAGTSMVSTIQQFALGLSVALAAILLHLNAFLFKLPLFSPVVFTLTFVVLSGLAGLTYIFIKLLKNANYHR